MTDYTSKVGFCQFCKKTQMASLHLKINNSRSESFCWVCEVCGRQNPFNGPPWIDSDLIYGHLAKDQINNLPLLITPAHLRCAKCGQRGAEEHHWAPKAIFGDDADKWPTDYLCVKCHNEWHEKMNRNVLQLEQPV